MDESIDEFRENFLKIKEKKQQQKQQNQLKLSLISKYLSPSSTNNTSSSSSSNETNTIEKNTNNENLSDSKNKLSLSKLNQSIVTPKASKTKQIVANNGISKYFNNNNKKEEKVVEFKCPICSLNLTKSNENDRQKHVNNCLDISIHSEENKKEKSKMKDEAIAITEKNDFETKNNESGSSTSKHPVENKQPNQVELLKEQIVPNCPICGKVLQSMNIRSSHLKKCAQVFHIKTDSLVELVKKQQDSLEADLARGLVPQDVYFIKTKKEPKENINKTGKSSGIKNRVIKLEQPSNKQDEKLQLAIALSNSLNPAEDCPKEVELKLFKNNQNSKKSTIKVDSKLLKTDENTRSNIISANFSTILSNQIIYNYNNSIYEEELKLKKRELIKTKFDSSKNYLFNKCKYFQETEENFYVELFLKSGRVVVGNNLFLDKQQINNSRQSDVQVLNTQTAFLLADLNNQTQENISIYCTQFNCTQAQDYSLNISTQSNQLVESRKSLKQANNFDEAQEYQLEIDISDKPYSFQEIDSNLINDNREIYFTDFNQVEFTSNKVNSNFQQEEERIDIDDWPDDNQINDDNNEKVEKTKLYDKKEKDDNPNPIDNIEMPSETQEKRPKPILSQILSLDNSTSGDDSTSSCTILDDYNKNEKAEDTFRSNNSTNKEIYIDETYLSINDGHDNQNHHESNKEEDVEIFDLTKEDDEDENGENEKSSSELNDLELNIDYSVSNNSNEESKSNTDEKRMSCNKKLNLTISNNTSYSRKRKSVDIISLDDDEDDQHKNCDINEEKENEANVSKKLKKDYDDLNQSKITEKESNYEIIVSEKSDSDCKDDDILITIPEKFLNRNSPPQYDNDLDEVWNNFGENQFENNDIYYNLEDNNNNDILIENDNESNRINNSIQSPKEKEKYQAFDSNNDADNLPDIRISPKFSSSEKTNIKKKINENTNKEISPLRDSTTTYKTPIIQKQSNPKNNQIVNLTPMPDYTSMDTPGLKCNLKKYGLKALPKKQAIKKLVEIYEYTHKDKIKTLQRSSSFNDLNTASKNSENKVAGVSSSDKTKKTSGTGNTKNLLKKTTSDIGFNSKKNNDKSSILKLGSNDKATYGSKNKQDCTLDEKLLELIEQEDENDNSNDEDDHSIKKSIIKQSQKEKVKKMLNEQELKQYLHDLIKSDLNLYLSVLNYEPIVYDEFLSSLQERLKPRRVNNQMLMKCLDEFCTTFTLKNLNTKKFTSKSKRK